jgi:hypothetical protein
MIQVKCPNCGKQLGIGDEYAGSLGMCPACAVTFLIPGPAVLLLDVPTAVPVQPPEPGEPLPIIPPSPTPPSQQPVSLPDWTLAAPGPDATAPAADAASFPLPVEVPASALDPGAELSLELKDGDLLPLDGPAAAHDDLFIPMPEENKPAPEDDDPVLALPVTADDLPLAPAPGALPVQPLGLPVTPTLLDERPPEVSGSELMPVEEPAGAVPVVVLPIPQEATPYDILPPAAPAAAVPLALPLAVPAVVLPPRKRRRRRDSADDIDEERFHLSPDSPRRRQGTEGMVSLVPGLDDRNLALLVLAVVFLVMMALPLLVPWLGWVSVLVGVFLWAMGAAWFRNEQRDAGFLWQVAFAFVPFLSFFFVLGSRDKTLRPFLVVAAGILLSVIGVLAMIHHFENLDRPPPPPVMIDGPPF